MTVSGLKDAPQVLVSASNDAGDKEVLDLSDRILVMEFHDAENATSSCRMELANDDLALYKELGLRTGSIINISWGYMGNMSPFYELKIIGSSNSAHKKLKKRSEETRAHYSDKHRSISAQSDRNTIKGFTVFKVEAASLGFEMHKDIKCRVFENMTRSEIARKIASEYGFSGTFVDVEDTKERYPIVTQARMTDAQFLKRLASKEGMFWSVDPEGFHFHRRRVEQAPVKVFRYFTDPGEGEITKIDELEINLGGKPGAVTVAGYDPINKKEIRHRATNANVTREVLAPEIELISPEDSTTRRIRRNASEHIIASPQHTIDSIIREANGRYTDAQLSTAKINFDVIGDASIRAKTVFEMQGLTDLFDGKYYITECKHRIFNGGFDVSIKSRRDGTNKSGTKSAGSLNKAAPTENKVTLVEVVNPEGSTTRYQFRDTKGRTIGSPAGSGSAPVRK